MSDVIIVGAGPTGLLLAGDLAEAGVGVTLLERRGEKISNLSRAFAVHARTMEELDARGLADELERTGVEHITEAQLFDRVHAKLGQLDSRFPYLLITPQFNVERVLLDRAVAAGAELVPDSAVTGLRQDATGVTVDVASAGGTTSTRRAAYVVGADGVRSAVREALGLPFPGRSVLKSIMLADVRLAEEPAAALTVNGTGDEFAFLAPFGDGWWRIFCWERRREMPDDAPLELEEVRAVTRRALGTDYGMHEARWLSRFHSDERQAPHYRVGRVFLAGDAAHCHSPAGGMGMNTGMQDAANLGWKLAAVLRGAPESLLDTYEAERHPVGKEVLRLSGTLIRLAMMHSRVGRFVRGHVGGAAARIPAVQQTLIGKLSAVGFAYRAPHGEHKLVGTRMPDVPLADGTRLYEALRHGRFVLLADAPGAEVPDGWADRVVAAVAAEPTGHTLLVRPDGYVARVLTGAELPTVLNGLAGRPGTVTA